MLSYDEKVELEQRRTNAIAKHLAAEDARVISYECPICDRLLAARPGEMCVSCTVTALRKARWL